MKAHLVVYIEIEEPSPQEWFGMAKEIIGFIDSKCNVIHAETIHRQIDIGGCN